METVNLDKVRHSWAAFARDAGINHYENLVALADAIVDSGEADGDLEDLFLLLSDLIEMQDKREFPVQDAAPSEVLKFLMERHDLTQAQVPEVGNQSVVSQVLAGKRQLNTRQIARLCARFGVGAGAFIPDAKSLAV